LEHLDLLEEAEIVRKAVARLMHAGVGTIDLKGSTEISCSLAGDLLEALVLDDDLKIDKKKFGHGAPTII